MSSVSKYLPTIKDIEFVCKATFGLLKIPVYFISEDKNILIEFSNKDSQNPMFHNKHQSLIDLVEENNTNSNIYLKANKYLENYIIMKIKGLSELKGTLLVGPSITVKRDSDAMDEFISDFNIPVKHKNSLLPFYSQMTVISYENLVNAALLIYYSLTHQFVKYEDFIRSESIPSAIKKQTETTFETYSLNRLQYGTYHHSQKSEQELLQSITLGNLEKLEECLKKPLDGAPGVHSKNPLRNQKNLFISTVPKISHAAVQGGMDWESALSLSDYYIQYAEELTDIKDIMNLFGEMYYDYAYRVKAQNSQAQSKIILKCKNYIHNHLYEKITLTKLSKNLSMNPSYLSHLFKKETGISLSEFILTEKITEAKKLLFSPEYKLADIYEILGFHDQSHFTKVFKKISGMTPKEYKTLYNS